MNTSSSASGSTFPSNWAYRQYMQSHAIEIMRSDQQHAIHATGVPAVYSTQNSKCLPAPSDLEQAYLAKWNYQRSLVSPYFLAKQEGNDIPAA